MMIHSNFKVDSLYQSKKFLEEMNDKDDIFYSLVEWIVEDIIEFKERNGDS